jgi:hypothetical protein
MPQRSDFGPAMTADDEKRRGQPGLDRMAGSRQPAGWLD